MDCLRAYGQKLPLRGMTSLNWSQLSGIQIYPECIRDLLRVNAYQTFPQNAYQLTIWVTKSPFHFFKKWDTIQRSSLPGYIQCFYKSVSCNLASTSISLTPILNRTFYRYSTESASRSKLNVFWSALSLIYNHHDLKPYLGHYMATLDSRIDWNDSFNQFLE